MTRLADPQVYSCPACAKYFTRSGFKSINFSGTRDWSDGAPTAWWSVGLMPLVRCSSCAALFWIEDLQPLGVKPKPPHPIGHVERLWTRWRGDPKGRLEEERKWLQVPEGWLGAHAAHAASFDDATHLLANSAGMRSERLQCLRSRIWWSLNDRYRNGSGEVRVLNAPRWSEVDERANMEALIDLLDSGRMKPREQVQKGELLRLLGRFDEAVAVLKAVPPDGHNEIRAVRIERLARQRDVRVRLLMEES